jgi:hypothetical protein
MAIDSNVLVFERLKEELKSGLALEPALEEAFKRAWTSIRDGHVSILISCAVLFWFSSSLDQGFRSHARARYRHLFVHGYGYHAYGIACLGQDAARKMAVALPCFWKEIIL